MAGVGDHDAVGCTAATGSRPSVGRLIIELLSI